MVTMSYIHNVVPEGYLADQDVQFVQGVIGTNSQYYDTYLDTE